MNIKAENGNAVWMMAASMLIFGTIGIFRRYIPVSSPLLACARGILGGLFLLILMKAKRYGAGEKLQAAVLLRLSAVGAMIGINWMLLFEAYNYTTVAVATLCYYMQPTIVMLLSPVLFREKLTLSKGICAAVALAGMVLVSGVIGGGLQAANLKGVLLGLGAAGFYSAVVILNKRITGVDSYTKTIVQLFAAGVVMVPYLLVTGESGETAFSARTLLLIAVVGMVHTGLAYALYFGAIERLKAQTIAILSYIDPVAAMVLAALILREPLSAAGITGAVLIIGAGLAMRHGGRENGGGRDK